MSTITVESLASLHTQLFNDLREYVRSQKSVWQKIPWLALEAYGRETLTENDPSVWEKGYWPVKIYNAGDTRVALVNLANGELVDVQHDGGTPIAQQMLVILGQLRRVDATYIINGLKEEAAQRYKTSIDPTSMEKWKKGVRARYNIRKVYTRS